MNTTTHRLDYCKHCGRRVTDFDSDGYEGEDAQRGHFSCDAGARADDHRLSLNQALLAGLAQRDDLDETNAVPMFNRAQRHVAAETYHDLDARLEPDVVDVVLDRASWNGTVDIFTVERTAQ